MINLVKDDKKGLSEMAEEMRGEGFSDSQIYDSLKKGGHSSVEIDDAVNQANLGPAEKYEEEIIEEAPEPGLKPSLLNDKGRKEQFGNPDENIDISYRNEPEESPGNFPGANFQRGNLSDTEALIESVIEEKWKSAIEKFGNLDVWKERVRTDVGSVKQEMIRLEQRFNNIEKAIMGKISQYDRNVVSIGNEIKVLEKVFQKIINPLTSNIKELSRITEDLKKRKK
ncbi:hypothetical protein HYX16_00980 [Candidatus Woesearchaeota archaeon]|nr:hypothetical protein [Candidatus Woesearchaeota archaeon]